MKEVNDPSLKLEQIASSTLITTSLAKFQCFDGEDFTQWLYISERFFEYDGTRDDEKLHVAVIHLDGDALELHRGFLRGITE